MNINTNQGISYIRNTKAREANGVQTNPVYNSENDTFIKTNSSQKQVSFSGLFSFISKILGGNNEPELNENSSSLTLGQRLSIGVKNQWGDKIPPENFNSVMKADDIRNVLYKLSTQNYVSNSQNQLDGTYCADLDYMSSFSYNGQESVAAILDSAAKYANSYYDRTGRKFMFALTDNDSLEGLKHAMRRIGNNPEKFKYLSFIPGIKMSFAYRVSDNRCENSRILVYGINPFSPNLNDFVDSTIERRENMVCEFLNNAAELYKEAHFNGKEFYDRNNIRFSNDLGQTNLYWRVREYITSKSDADIMGMELTPEEIYKMSEDIFAGLDSVYNDSGDFDNFCRGIIGNEEDANILVRKLFDRFSTRYNPKTKEIASDSENVYRDFVHCFIHEPSRPVMALAEPYYLTHYFEKPGTKSFDNVIDFIKRLQKDSEGMLIAFETVAPLYERDNRLLQSDIDNFNFHISKSTDLKEVGGSFAQRDFEELPTNID